MSNCWVFALNKLFREGGYLIPRMSEYTWVVHVFWAPSIEGLHVEELAPWAALMKFVREGGYLVLAKRLLWAPSIDGLYVEEYKPSKEYGQRVRGSWWRRAFPIHSVIFRGRVRTGKGEEFPKD